MNTSYRLRKWEISLLLALCVTLLTGSWAQARESSLASGLIRLHVIAVSDDAVEQQIKLRVRDSVLRYLSPRLSGAGSTQQAEKIISDSLGGIRSAAQEASGGRAVSVTLSDEYYPTREYTGFALPAGKYRSLRVVLGEGRGHNWWCVVFPPLCVDAASRDQAARTMSGDDYGIVTQRNGYVLKFRLLELWGELMGSVNKEK